MKIELRRFDSPMRRLMRSLMRQEGNGVTDVAMVVALVATGAIAGLNSVATDVNIAFATLATTFSSLGSVAIKHL